MVRASICGESKFMYSAPPETVNLLRALGEGKLMLPGIEAECAMGTFSYMFRDREFKGNDNKLSTQALSP